jgi:hypothetical protein
MYPHERSLVEKYDGRPFALIGVNSDDDREELKRVMGEKELTWRSFFDGGLVGGPIATRWGVTGWPTIFVLDHEGVIRHRNLRDEPLEEAIDALVRAAEGRRRDL